MAIQRSYNVLITDSSVTGNAAPLGGGLASDSSAMEFRGVNMTANSAEVASSDNRDQVRRERGI
jgi:hypothetical protein